MEVRQVSPPRPSGRSAALPSPSGNAAADGDGADAASPSREAFDAARKAPHENLIPRSSDDGKAEDDTLHPLPDGPPALAGGGGGAPMMTLPLDLRASPASPEQSPDGPGASFRAAASASGLDAPISLAFVSPHRGTQRRRGLLAACATPRSSTPRLLGEDSDEHASQQQQRPVSALLDGLTTPVADTLSGGVNGLYQWPATYSRQPDQAPPRERERLRITLQCWLGTPPALPALPGKGKSAETPAPAQVDIPAGWGGWLSQWFIPQAAEPALGAVPSLERLNELERQLTVAALADASTRLSSAHRLATAQRHAQGQHQGGRADGSGSGAAGNMMRSSASESDLMGRQRAATVAERPDERTYGSTASGSRTPSPDFDKFDGASGGPVKLWPGQEAGAGATAVLKGSERLAQERRLEGLHTALRGLLSVYDTAAPQLLSLANDISESAELWDSLLFRPHRYWMLRWLNLRSFRGDKPPTVRLAELRSALGRLALLVGALQMFASELHRAARTQDSGDWETAVGPTDEIGIQGMLRAVRGLAATLGASAPAVAAVHTHRYAPGNNMVISGSFGSTTGRFASTPISQLSWILLCSTTGSEGEYCRLAAECIRHIQASVRELADVAHEHAMPPRNTLPYTLAYTAVAGLAAGYLYRNRGTLVPQVKSVAAWLWETTSDFATIHMIEPTKNIYVELVYHEHFTLGKAETIKNELAYSRVQFAKVMTLWENAARSSMGEARLEELALQSPDGLIDTGALRQLRLDEQVADPVMSILTGDLLHMLLLEMCEVKVQALEVVAALEEVMKENNMNMQLASIAPTILVSGSVLYGLSCIRSFSLNIVALFRARERRTSADRLRMIRRRLLLVERSLQGGAAELQETEMPSLALLPFVTKPHNDSAAARDGTHAVGGVQAPAGMGGFGGSPTRSASARRPPPRGSSLSSLSSSPSSGSAGSVASAAASVMRAPAQDLGGNSAAAAVAERIWGVVDEGNRTVLLGRLFELSSHPDCFLGVTDARFGLAEAFQNDLHELVCPWLSNAQKRRVVDRMHRTYTFLGEPSGSRRLLSWWV